jgi:hypothetical protein
LELSGSWAEGDADWHTRAAAPAARPAAPGEPERLDPAAIRLSLRRPARRPSDETTGVRPAARMFALERNRGAAFGSAVHALFAAVEWAGPEEQAGFAAAWPALGPAGEEALACLRAPDLAAVWARPAGRAEVWRERVFEIVLEGVWYTGVFDRVIVTRDPAGRVDGAWVIDFKTDRARPGDEGEGMSEQHAGQLELYRRVAGVLTGLATNRVKCALVMTASRRLVDVPVRA